MGGEHENFREFGAEDVVEIDVSGHEGVNRSNLIIVWSVKANRGLTCCNTWRKVAHIFCSKFKRPEYQLPKVNTASISPACHRKLSVGRSANVAIRASTALKTNADASSGPRCQDHDPH
jgi:hypothetical protein